MAQMSRYLKTGELLAILNDLYKGRDTGTLVLQKEAITKFLYFQDGQVIFAASNAPEDKFTQILIDQGRLTVEQVNLATQKREARTLGRTLVDLGFISSEDLLDALIAQVRKIALSTAEWASGNSSFKPNVLPPGVAKLPITTERLVVDTALGMQDRTWVGQTLGGLDTVLKISGSEKQAIREMPLSAEESKILNAVNGANTIREICETAGVDAFMGAKFLLGLFFLQWVHRKEVLIPRAHGEESKVDLSFLDEVVPSTSHAQKPAEVVPEPLLPPPPSPPPALPLEEPAMTFTMNEGTAPPEEPSGPVYSPLAFQADPDKEPTFFHPDSPMPLEADPKQPDPPIEDEDSNLRIRPIRLNPALPSLKAKRKRTVTLLVSLAMLVVIAMVVVLWRQNPMLPGMRSKAKPSPVKASAKPTPPSPANRPAPAPSLPAANTPLPSAAPAPSNTPTPVLVPPAAKPPAAAAPAPAAPAPSKNVPVTAAPVPAPSKPLPSPPPQPSAKVPPAKNVPAPIPPGPAPSKNAMAPVPPAPAPAKNTPVPPPAKPAPAKNAPVAPPAKSVPEPAKPVPEKAASPSQGGDLLKQGKYPEAAQAFAGQLKGSKAEYTIDVEIACQPDTIVKGLTAAQGDPSFMILPYNFHGRSCYRVIWGTYKSRSEAEAALKKLPGHFLSDQQPPRVAPWTAVRPDR
jgi:hypothetical protein